MFELALGAWLIINVMVTRRVLAVSRKAYLPTRMLVIAIWVLPFFGACMAFVNTPSLRVIARAAEIDTPRDRSAEYGAPPATLARPTASAGEQAGADAVFAVAEQLQSGNGLPILNWRALSEWAAAPGQTAEDTARSVAQGRHAWLLHLRAALGPHMGLFVTDDAYVLSSLDPKLEKGTADYISSARVRIRRLLGELAHFPVEQRSIVLVLDGEEDYYRYVSIYYPDGEFAVSGGMFIDAGCPHFVVVRGSVNVMEPVIAHELTHSALSHLHLPRWLDEGIAVNAERRVAGPQGLQYTPHELHAMHLAHWNTEQIQGFWSGRSFLQPDDGTMLSYELARIIVEQMARQWDSFASFVRAAQATLAVDLGAYAAALVEAEPTSGWAPNPTVWS